MDFLFLNHNASIEALIVFLSLGVIFLSFLYDVIVWARVKYRELNPRKVYSEPSTEIKDVPMSESVVISELKANEGGRDVLDTYSEEQDSILQSESSVKKESEEEMGENNEKISSNEPPSTEETIDEEEVAHGIADTPTGEKEVSTGSEEDTIPSDVCDTTIIEDPEEDQTGVMSKETGGADAGKEEKLEVTDSVESTVLDNPIDIGMNNKKDEKENKEITAPKHETEGKEKPIRRDKMDKLVEIVNNVKTLIARGHIDDARTLIINGLSLQKNHRELNMLMANLYEREHAFEKAEFILKELAEKDSTDAEVLLHLATVVAMQKKFDVAYELYKKVISIQGEAEETLYTLTHIASELTLQEDVYMYAKSYLKQYPKNPEILWLYSQSQIAKGDRRGAIETLIKLKNLTPYNQEIIDLISKLVTEDELAGNFGEEK